MFNHYGDWVNKKKEQWESLRKTYNKFIEIMSIIIKIVAILLVIALIINAIKYVLSIAKGK